MAPNTTGLHRFDASRTVEARWAPVLDAAFRETGYQVRPASMREQWRGIDRVVIDEDGVHHRVEYKCDEKHHVTRNTFIETMSNAGTGRRGCVLTSEAHWLLYFLTPHRVLVFWLGALRGAVPAWRTQFPEKASRNEGYDTLGLCVPVSVAEGVAEYVARMDQHDALILQRRDRT